MEVVLSIAIGILTGSGVYLLHSQRTDGGDKAGLVGLSLTERKAPMRTAREISA